MGQALLSKKDGRGPGPLVVFLPGAEVVGVSAVALGLVLQREFPLGLPGQRRAVEAVGDCSIATSWERAFRGMGGRFRESPRERKMLSRLVLE